MSVQLHTQLGTLSVTLYTHDAPKTCRNFIELAKSGYYDGCIFHRVVPNFVVQTGDPELTGEGGMSIYGDVFDDEFSGKLSHDGPGVVSMANCGRNTNGSQFFVSLRAAPHLDGKHTIFGRVTAETLHVLDEFAKIRLKKKRPVHPVKLYSVEVLRDPYAGQPLPAGASIPEKPLITIKDDKNCNVM